MQVGPSVVIAYVPETGVFLVTGKLWPKLLALRLDG